MRSDHTTIKSDVSADARVGKRHGIARVLGLVLASGLSLVLVCTALATREPDWWAKCQPLGDMRVLGTSAEHRVIAEASRVRSESGTPWEVTLTQDECNAWLMQRFPEWIASMQDTRDANSQARSPIVSHTHDVRVCCEGDSPTLGVRDESGRIVWATVTWRDGSLHANGFGVGSMRVPRALASKSSHIARLERIITDATHEAVRLPDGRRVQIVSLQSNAGTVKLAGMTLGAE